MKDKHRNNSPNPTHRTAAFVMAILFLSFVGAGIAIYLIYVDYSGLAAVCFPNMKCDVVLSSRYARMWGIPISLLGLMMYLGIAGLSLGSFRIKEESKILASLGIYIIALAGIIFTCYLYYLEIFVLHGFCTWCVGSSIVLVIIFVLSVFNLRVTGQIDKQ